MPAALRSDTLFAVLVGLIDGIGTALLLAGAQLLDQRTLAPGLILRISLVAGLGGILPLLAAEYARQRGELAHAARELNLTAPRRLLQGALGRRSVWVATRSAGIAATSAFTGACFCLGIGALAPRAGWISLLVANLILFAVGWWLAQLLSGRRLRWALALALGADAMTVLGLVLHVTR